jgi:tetratricopeptide (TPR) repeat protein
MSSPASFDASAARDADALLSAGVSHFQGKRWRDALVALDRVVVLGRGTPQVHNYRARAFEALDRNEEALRCLDEALSIDPHNLADRRNRAVMLTKLQRLDEAIAGYQELLATRPDDVDVLVRLSLTLNQAGRREEALGVVRRAVELKPDAPDVLNARVIVLDNLGRYADALNDLDRMLAIEPNHLDAINNAGMILARMGRFKDALACYDRSLNIKPDQPQARYNRSLVRLSLGDWIRGFKEFESRWTTAPLNKTRLSGLGPLWLGGDEDLSGKRVLLYHEQGYGDTLQCVRYIPLLAERGARVALAVPPPLAPLMRSVKGVSAVLTGVEGFPAHDLQAPLMSLMLAFRTTPDTVPAQVPYLSADAQKVAGWKSRLRASGKRRIGIAWSGRRYAPVNYPRDLGFAALRPILSLNAQFVSLQKEIPESDRDVLAQLTNLQRFEAELGDFADTAALIEALDLIITVDTAIAHLAGALGKPIWLLNRFAACWRWLQEGSHSVWYPTLRQFRQTNVGDWTPVVTQVRSAAEEFLRTGNTLIAESDVPSSTARSGIQRQASSRPKIRFVTATRLSKGEFFKSTPLGRSLPNYREFPKHQVIEVRVFPNNSEGLSTIYNTAIEEAGSDPAILIFIHDDVYLSDYYWAEHLHEALEHFDIVGLAGNRRRVPRQASWMYLDEEFTRDNYDNLSGVLGHGDPFPNLRQLSVYGEPGQEVKLLDGVMLAVRSHTLVERDLRFDPRFRFHFYDMDFCRQAEIRNIRMGTWAISVVHASAGALGVEDWRSAYRSYLTKYGEV